MLAGAAVAVVLIALAGCSSGRVAMGPEEARASEEEAGIGGLAPDFTLQNAAGEQVKLSDYQGQVVLLNFWATWCGPCKIEMPWFIEFQRKYKDQGFAVLAVSLDEEGWDVVRPYAEELKANFPVLLGDEQVADSFGSIQALPTTLIIDRQGRISKRHQGLVSKGEYVDGIESLL
jgi:cytochrome c biogenesis protein CcmG/thiol:disulfide interchange protein DsbE